MMTFKKQLITSLTICIAAISLSACSGAKKKMGLEKKAPDEFAVVKRAPLSLPPGYELRPPRPGAMRPQEQTPNETAKQVVFGAQTQDTPKETTSTENLLLKQAGATNANPAIRDLVNQESAEQRDENQPVVEKLLNIGGNDEPLAIIVDAPKEAERIRNNKKEGKPVTEGETPYKKD